MHSCYKGSSHQEPPTCYRVPFIKCIRPDTYVSAKSVSRKWRQIIVNFDRSSVQMRESRCNTLCQKNSARSKSR